ncbi:MAG: HAD domain-containing protein [Pseudomonadota bacterium]
MSSSDLRAPGLLYVMLDIDGVLCPKQALEPAPGQQTWARGWATDFDPGCLRYLTDAVLSHAHARIVISSNWRKREDLSTLQIRFGAALGERVIGVTPVLESTTRHYRLNEVLLYFKQQGLTAPPWVALEDDFEHFPTDAPVICTGTETGITAADGERLSRWFASGGANPP